MPELTSDRIKTSVVHVFTSHDKKDVLEELVDGVVESIGSVTDCFTDSVEDDVSLLVETLRYQFESIELEDDAMEEISKVLMESLLSESVPETESQKKQEPRRKQKKGIRAKDQKKKKGANKKTTVRRAVKETASKEQEDHVPVWLSKEAEKNRTGGKDVNIRIRMSNIGGGTELITGADLILTNGRHYGLIGDNGAGKSTLLNHISKYLFPDFPKYLHVQHVEQEVPGDETKVIDFVVNADKERTMLMEEKRVLEEGTRDDETAAELERIYGRLKEIGAFDAPARAATILAGLGFSEEMQQKTTNDLSGGLRMRVALASALLIEPDILLCDEPTNHLDFPSLLWLTDYLQSYEKTLVVVSHDRKFLNDVTTDIIHLFNKSLIYYRGNYDTFEKVRAEQLRCAWKAYLNQQEKIKHTTEFINKWRANKKLSSMVQSRIKELNKMEKLEKPLEDQVVSFRFPTPDALRRKVILEGTDISFGYDPERPLFQNVQLRVEINSRIGVLGRNGAGKSTLLKLLLRELEPQNGYAMMNSEAVLGYFAQHHVEQMREFFELAPIEMARKEHPECSVEECFQQLARFNVKGKIAKQRISTLSGGQKSRLSFARLSWNKPHLYIMDEPTNHLDLQTIDALIDALKNFEGAVLTVSHDQHFLTNVCNEFWAVGEGGVKAFYEFEEAVAWSYQVSL